MFSQLETLTLFGLSTFQGVILARLIEDTSGMSVLLALPAGLLLGFVLSMIELTVFNYLRDLFK